MSVFKIEVLYLLFCVKLYACLCWECGRFVFMSECVCLCVGVHVSKSMFSSWGAHCLPLNLVPSDCVTVRLRHDLTVFV